MIAGERLAAWLADPEAHRRSYRGVEACARRGDAHARGEIEGALALL